MFCPRRGSRRVTPSHDGRLDPLNGIAGAAPTYDFPWYFNLGRTRVRGDEKQAMIFSPTEKRGFHDKDKFGKLYIRNPRLEKQRTGK